jgi:hypothetical protein
MIRPEDFKIDISQSPTGASVHVLHRPTGKERRENNVPERQVGQVRDRLLRELESGLYGKYDFEIRTGRAVSGDFVQVIHIPSRKSREICPIGKRSHALLTRDMMDSILEELFREAGKKERDDA